MSSKGDLSEDATLQAKNAAQKSARPWLERLARLGYATEGAMYALIGLLAAGVAFGSGGHRAARRFGNRRGKPLRRRLGGFDRARLPGLRPLAGHPSDN